MKHIYFLIMSLFVSAFINAQQKNIGLILDGNGTVKPGSDGSYNAEGYRMNYGKNNEPIFQKNNSLEKTTTYSWNSLPVGISDGTEDFVYAVAVSGSDIYVGGSFVALGDGSSARHIAKWNGSSWSALACTGGSNGVNNTVKAISVSGSNVYVGGYFTALGDGTVANRIAKWDGNSWSALIGSGINGLGGNVYAVASSGSILYVGGSFTLLGDNSTSAKCIAKWDGSNWSSLSCSGGSNGVNNTVFALTFGESYLYLGGDFTSLGDATPASHAVRWDGSGWSTLTGGGSNGTSAIVRAIATSGSDVYIGGDFTTLGNGATANHIAKWNNGTWSILSGNGSNGVNDIVNAIAVSGSDVYVAGDFLKLGDNTTSANYMAKWSGASWSAVGSGANGYINSLEVNPSEGKMYVGGEFTSLGSTSVKYVGNFSDSNNPLPVELISLSAILYSGSVTLTWKTSTEVNNYGFDIERASLDGSSSIEALNWQKVGSVQGHGNSNSIKEYSFTDTAPLSGKICYRLKQIDTDGKFAYSDYVAVDVAYSPKIVLEQNYPNPFNPSTAIRFSLNAASNICIKVFDITGREVTELVNEAKPAGSHIVYWNGNNSRGGIVSSGIYIYQLIVNNKPVQVKKMTLLK